MLLGDQIYADAMADLFDARELDERYRDRYRRAFGRVDESKGFNAHKLFSHVPTYFALDDHEIINDWDGDLTKDWDGSGRRKNREMYTIARREAWNYQMHHSAVGNSKKENFWYDFGSAGFQNFVLDTRTQRRKGIPRNDLSALIGIHNPGDGIINPQWKDFTSWLDAAKDDIKAGKPIIIASGSPIGPIPQEWSRFPGLVRFADNLLGYPGFLVGLHKLFIEMKAINVIWLSGDPHFSCVTDVEIEYDGDIVKIVHVVASGLFAPLPFTNDRLDRYVWDKWTTLDYGGFGGGVGNLRVRTFPTLLTNEASHFVRLDLSEDRTGGAYRLDVAAYGTENQLLAGLQKPLIKWV